MNAIRNYYFAVILLMSIGVGSFYFFTSSIHFAGGGSHFLDWALALVGDRNFNPDDLAQRDIGFSLILLLSAFTITKSFDGVIGVQLVFAILMPIIVFLILFDLNRKVAFIASLATILTLSPFVLIKFVYHDQTYIFFMLLSSYLLLKYIKTEDKNIYLYSFTIAILFASYSRSAGNYIYPLLLLFTYLLKRNNVKYYLISLIIFGVGFSIYMAHRKEMFGYGGDRSGIGLQSFYSTYIPLGDAEVKFALRPEMGENTAKLISGLKEYIGEDIKSSRLIKDYSSGPKDFLEKNIYNKTPEQLNYAILNEPCEEYMWMLYGVFPGNDAVYRNVSLEIIKEYPAVFLRHIAINLYSMLFDPGLNFGRYDVSGRRGHSGVDFLPAQGTNGAGGAGMQDATPYGEKLVREIDYRPLEHLPGYVKSIFLASERYYVENYRSWVSISNIFIIICWVCLIYYYLRGIRTYFPEQVKSLCSSSFVISIFLLYEVALDGILAGPHMRYFHFTELFRIILCGYALNFLLVSNKILRGNLKS